ncbi:MAG: PdxA family dehydrogenase [Brevinema sp.]
MSADLLITLGDPAGIGGEVVFKALNCLDKNARGRFLLIGNSYILKDSPFQHEVTDNIEILAGQESSQSGLSALKALEKAVSLLKNGRYKGLVTAPVSKKAIVEAGNTGFHGHTDYLGEAFSCQPEMIFYSPKWSVLLATVHIPIKEVPSHLTADRLEQAIRNAWAFQRDYLKKTQAIGVCGLNPHAGEGGIIGREEQEIFIPVIEKLRKEGIPLAGPIAGDIAFRLAEQGVYSVLVSSYHDQALAPFKLLHFQDGINVSMGLPFLRCSPDHGCAFDLAGKNKADHIPTLNALLFALKNCP